MEALLLVPDDRDVPSLPVVPFLRVNQELLQLSFDFIPLLLRHVLPNGFGCVVEHKGKPQDAQLLFASGCGRVAADLNAVFHRLDPFSEDVMIGSEFLYRDVAAESFRHPC